MGHGWTIFLVGPSYLLYDPAFQYILSLSKALRSAVHAVKQKPYSKPTVQPWVID